MAGTPDDMTVIAQVLGGDTDAFEILLARYECAVAQLVAAHVPGCHVDEVAHDTFIRAYKSLPGYVPVKPFPNWLTTIATRSCHDFWRKQYRCKEAPVCDLSDDGQRFIENALAAESKEEFDQMARQQEARELLDLVLDKLSPLDRMILTLTYLEERSVRETSDMLGISMPNVKIRAFRAKRKLRGFLKLHGIQGGLHEY
ncbi:MAG: RNA polymerase sigma factor [Pseudodesulfovibrio sp.]